MNSEKVLRDFAEELYFRAACAKDRNERMALKGVQHSLERALAKNGIETFDRHSQGVEASSNENDKRDA